MTNQQNKLKLLERKYKSAIHWALIRQREPIMCQDPSQDGYVPSQASSCPHYVPLSEGWGADWGVIMHPQSKKFGQLVFEHEWCGCEYHATLEENLTST